MVKDLFSISIEYVYFKQSILMNFYVKHFSGIDAYTKKLRTMSNPPNESVCVGKIQHNKNIKE